MAAMAENSTINSGPPFGVSGPPFGVNAIISHADAASKSQAWLSAAPAEILSAHPKRRSEWISARVALEIAFSSQGVFLDPANARFSGFQSLEGFPDWRFSLSHDDVMSIAWLTPARAALSIGVDLEQPTRTISKAVHERFVTASDDNSLSAIALWGIKEAAYKTLSKAEQEKFWLNDLVVKADRTFAVAGTIRGRWLQNCEADSLCSYAWTDRPTRS
jgi:4'-phosphopantetheinyl transferase EntD